MMQQELVPFKFIQNERASGTMNEWVHHTDILMASAKKHLGLTSIPAAASIFMRRYGLFITGHLYLFSKERRIWNGSPAVIDIVIDTGEPWPIFFQLKHNQWEPCGDEGAGLILERLVNPVIEALADNMKLPPVISRENLFGYALWMYVHILEDTRDLRLLKGYERFLQNKDPLEAMENYSRLTCCLYKEAPGCDKCPYCPLHKCGAAPVCEAKP
jgi:ferric iron reductase protein FhuF